MKATTISEDELTRLFGSIPDPAVPRGFVERALARPVASGAGIRYAAIALPVASLFVAFDQGVVLSQVGGHAIGFETALFSHGWSPVPSDPPGGLLEAIQRLVEGAPFGYPIDARLIGPFQRRVLDATAGIPRGEFRTYAQVAGVIGSPAATRAVGTALARNPIPFLIPCHRVVRTDRRLGEYSGGGKLVKAQLLRWEGVPVASRGEELRVAPR